MPKSNAERQKAKRAKKIELGLTKIEIWAHPNDVQLFKALETECKNKRLEENKMATLTANNSNELNTVARSVHRPNAEEFTTYAVKFNTKTKEAIFVKYFRNDNKQEVVGKANCKSRSFANAIFEKWESNNFEKLEI